MPSGCQIGSSTRCCSESVSGCKRFSCSNIEIFGRVSTARLLFSLARNLSVCINESKTPSERDAPAPFSVKVYERSITNGGMLCVCKWGQSSSSSWKKLQTPAGPSSERAVSRVPQENETVHVLRFSAPSQLPVWHAQANSRSSEREFIQYSGCVMSPRLAAAFINHSVTSS